MTDEYVPDPPESDAELPFQHIIRPQLPWRAEAEARTECGRKPDAHAIDRVVAAAKIRKQGQTRASLTTCITCWQTASRHPGWDQAPSMVVQRYIKNRWWRDDRYDPESETVKLDRELRAIWDLIQKHPQEWADLLYVHSVPNELAARRAQQRRRG